MQKELYEKLAQAQKEIGAAIKDSTNTERKALQQIFKKRGRAGCQEARRPMAERLLERVVFGISECWNWCGCTNAFGYGRITSNGRLQVAHRISWETFKGPIPNGLSVLHTCDNPSCINPEHLWLGTYSDNIRDAWSKGRHKGRTGRGRIQ